MSVGKISLPLMRTYTRYGFYNLTCMTTITSKESDFEHLFSTYKIKFTNFAFLYVKDKAIAEDIVIDSFVYFWENKHRLVSEDNIPAYILTMIKHKCLNHLKRQQLHQAIVDNMVSHSQWELSTRISTLEACEPYHVFSEEIKLIVSNTLKKMSKQTELVFRMSRMNNMSHKEIAEKMNMSAKSVEFHIAKVLKKLRHQLKDYLCTLF